MNFPCPTSNPCANDNPFANNSAEAPDPFLFHGLNFGKVDPPLGTAWDRLTCVGVADSQVSQAAADLAATVAADECVINHWQLPDGPTTHPNPPVPPPVNTRGSGRPFVPYLNSPQSAMASCPDGLPFTYTVPAGLFFGLSQADANAKALSYAQSQVAQHIVCLSNLPGQVCAGSPVNSGITATGMTVGAFNDWELFGVLPPGLSLPTGLLNTATIALTGTPTMAGSYSFSVGVTTPDGDFIIKPYTLLVAGITNAAFIPAGVVGMAYAFALVSAGVVNPIFGVSAGSLPPGLAVDIFGNITGTPTTAGTYPVTLGVTEAGTGLTCNVGASIKVTNPAFNCGATPQNIQDTGVWNYSAPISGTCFNGVLTNGTCPSWGISVEFGGCSAVNASPTITWSTMLCNPGAAYLLTVTLPWSDNGCVVGMAPFNFTLRLIINGVTVGSADGDILTGLPLTLSVSGMLPANQVSSVVVQLDDHAIAPCGPGNGYTIFSTGNLTVTPLTHP